jgi:hypothetical protein
MRMQRQLCPLGAEIDRRYSMANLREEQARIDSYSAIHGTPFQERMRNLLAAISARSIVSQEFVTHLKTCAVCSQELK